MAKPLQFADNMGLISFGGTVMFRMTVVEVLLLLLLALRIISLKELVFVDVDDDDDFRKS